jgi:hypothetical protein
VPERSFLGLIFTDDEIEARAALLQAKELAAGHRRQLVEYNGKTAESIAADLELMLRRERTNDIAWIDWSQLHQTRDKEAVDVALGALNAGRSRVLATFGGVILVLPIGFEPRVSYMAVDLWSVRNFAMRIPPGAVISSGGGSVASEQVRNITIGYNADIVPLMPGPMRSPADVDAPAAIQNLPRRTAVTFIGRRRDMAELQRASTEGEQVITQVVLGLGGIGKSELALQYAARNAATYSVRWWITADSPDAIAAGLAGLAFRLQPVMKTAVTVPEAADWALDWLQCHQGWLMVLDNVEHPPDVEPLLARLSSGRILITTRHDIGWPRLGLARIRLGMLTRAESIVLLERLTARQEPEAAEQLAEELGDLPLALEQAAAYITARRTTIRDYLDQLRTQPARVLETEAGSSTGELAVARVWAVSIAAITSQIPLARRILDVLAYLAPDQLPRDVLTGLAEDALEVDDALALLASYSMIMLTEATVSVHPLVQAVTRNNPIDSVGEAAEADDVTATRLLCDAIPADPWTNVGGWPRWRALLPHIEALTMRREPERDDEVMTYLLDHTATYQEGQGQVTEAITKFERAYFAAQRIFGPDHRDTLTSANNLAGAYESAGRLTEAIPLFEATYANRQRVLGDDHPGTLASANNLASAYESAGRPTEAIPLFEATHANRRRILGDDHPDTLASANNLAGAYSSAGRLTEAIPLFEATHANARLIFGAEHPNTLTLANNLAGAYESAGRPADAIRLYEATLASRRRIFGDEDPTTRATKHSLEAARENHS